MVTLHFVPYQEIADISSAKRVKKLIDLVKQDKIVLLEGRLKKDEERDLITITMEEINSRFKGIEIAVINPKTTDLSLLKTIKLKMLSAILGNRIGFTIIGPASIVKEIKQNPDKIELLMKDKRRRK